MTAWPDRLPTGAETTVAVKVTGTLNSEVRLLDATLIDVVPCTTLMVKVCAALVFTPPFAVPPLSCSVTVTVAEPVAFAAGV